MSPFPTCVFCLLSQVYYVYSVFFTSLSLLAYCSVACLFCCRVVAFYILSLSCHLPQVVFFLKSTVSDCIYWINRSFFSVSSHDAMTTSLGCSHVLFMSSLFPDVIHRICFGVTFEILSLCLSLLTFQYRIFFCLCLSYFLCQKTPYLCNQQMMVRGYICSSLCSYILQGRSLSNSNVI